METALGLAARGLGRVWPNPAVGCVLVKDGRVVGQGWTQTGGRPHAEFMALDVAGDQARGATAYVTLEPCAHEGVTPSCARLLAEAGVARVLYAAADPDPRTNGEGAEILKKAGAFVEKGLCETEASDLNRGFILRQTLGRPLVAMKVAASADGKIAAKEGAETRITGIEARIRSHELRAAFDAILVGIGTVLADDPELTCRIAGEEGASPVRIILDSRARIPANSKLLNTLDKAPLWVVTEALKIPAHLKREGVEIVSVKDIRNIEEVLEKITEKGITRLLIEGGASINASVLESGLVDCLYWFTNPRLILGESAVPAVRGVDASKGAEIPGFDHVETAILGKDTLDFFVRKD